jgi:hypothetical protein
MCRDCATPGERVAGDLAALNIALHNLGQDSFPFPVMFIAAGLPSLPAVLADATSYAERLYDFRKIGLLDATSTSEALVLPAETYGVSWDRSALHAAVDPKVENYACPAAGTLSVPPASAKPATLLRRTAYGHFRTVIGVCGLTSPMVSRLPRPLTIRTQVPPTRQQGGAFDRRVSLQTKDTAHAKPVTQNSVRPRNGRWCS